jgi:hypothetical protein
VKVKIYLKIRTKKITTLKRCFAESAILFIPYPSEKEQWAEMKEIDQNA